MFASFGSMILASAAIFLSFAYAAAMLAYLLGWRALPEWRLPKHFIPRKRISVIIPCRNEAKHIGACTGSIIDGSYPPDLLEVIVVDDFSEDETVAAAGERVRVLRLDEILPEEARQTANKKQAISTGISQARGDIIVTTDADCIAPPDWLLTIAARFEKERGVGEADPVSPILLAAPVVFHREHNLLQRFQSLDFLGMMGITGAGIKMGFQRMANGANLAFDKSLFDAVDGYSGNVQFASGDDMFLVQKIARYRPGSIFFLKNRAAAVRTEARPDWRTFWQQRLRWGTKNAALTEWPVRLVLLLVFLFCWSILINGLLAIAGLVAGDIFFLKILALQLAVKAASDYLFLREMCRFFERRDLLRWFAPCFLMHTAYIAVIGLASLFFRRFEWKGRRVQ